MATTMKAIEVWVLIDDEGNYVASDDADALNEQYEEHVQEVSNAAGTRRVKITVTVPLPTQIEVSGEVAVNEEIGELKAA